MTAWLVVSLGRAIAGISITSGFEGIGETILQILLAIACGILAVVAGTFVTSRRFHPIAALIGLLAVGFILWLAPSLGYFYLASLRVVLIATAAAAAAGVIGVAFAFAAHTAINRRRLIAFVIIVPLLFIVAAIRTVGANYLFDSGRVSLIERSWEHANGGETWAPPGAHSRVTEVSFQGNQLDFIPNGSSAGLVETPANASPSAEPCRYRNCVERTSPNGHPMWFASDYMGRPSGSGTQVVLGHTVINLDFPVVNENQDAALTDLEMAYRSHVVDSLRGATLNSIMRITWPDVTGP